MTISDVNRVLPHVPVGVARTHQSGAPRHADVALPEARRDFSTFRYTVRGTTHDLDHFMTTLNVVGLLVITDGRIVLERYARGHTAETRWESWSVAKSVTSLLFGAAIRDGRIATLDDEVSKYIPSLAGTSYDGVTLRHLLQMSSGVAWNGNMADPDVRRGAVAALEQGRRARRADGLHGQQAAQSRTRDGLQLQHRRGRHHCSGVARGHRTDAVRLPVRENLAAVRDAVGRLLDDDGHERRWSGPDAA